MVFLSETYSLSHGVPTPSSVRLPHDSSGHRAHPLTGWLSHQTTSPRAPWLQRRYPLSSLLQAHAPILVPPTSTSRSTLIGGVLVAYTIHNWSQGLSRLSACSSFLKCHVPYAGGSLGALDQFFPNNISLHHATNNSAFRFFPPTASGR